MPFGTLFALCFLWFGISVPLVFVGSYFGYRKPAPEDPVRTNKIPRQIPEQVCTISYIVLLRPDRAWGAWVTLGGCCSGCVVNCSWHCTHVGHSLAHASSMHAA